MGFSRPVFSPKGPVFSPKGAVFSQFSPISLMKSTFGEKMELGGPSRFKIVEKKIVLLRAKKIYLVKYYI
tara:strand:+ start:474 stop:683 length:210 start_codon:yes stop_codon:yes gene_type:complete